MSAGEARSGGVVFRIGADAWFLPASVAARVVPMPAVTAVPGASVELAGLAHVDGEILPVLSLDGGTARASAVIVCAYLGEHVGLAVDAVEYTGLVDHRAGSDGVQWAGGSARSLDLVALCERAHRGAWAMPSGVSSGT